MSKDGRVMAEDGVGKTMTMPKPGPRKATARRAWPRLRWRMAGPRPAGP